MIKAVIFDMDGVILNTEPVYEQSAKLLFKEVYGLDLHNDIINKTKGMREQEEFRLYKNIYKIKDNAEEISKKRNFYFYEIAKKNNLLFKGTNEKLNELSSSYILALTTSTQGEKFEFETKFFNLQLFKEVVNGSQVMHSKPDPEGYNKTITLLGLKPSECVVIEDAINGVMAARLAGAKCIGILGTFSEEELKKAGADIVIKGITQLNKEIIDGLGD